MGKASKWLRGVFGFKKSEPTPAKKRWSFGRTPKEKDGQKSQNDDEEAGRHAMAVAAATAAVAEAAVAAAQAAAAVVKLTSGGGFVYKERAAVMIQSHFRAYLSRRALKALKAVVKLQALVRGEILRKHYADKQGEMKAIARVQARARAGVLISPLSFSSTNSSPINHSDSFVYRGRALRERLDYTAPAMSSTKQQEQLMMLKRKGSRSKSNVSYDHRRRGERSWDQGSFPRIDEKILEVDTWKPKHKHAFHSPQLSHSSNLYCQSFSWAHQTTRLSPSSIDDDEINANFSTAENSPQYYSASSTATGRSKRAPFSPTKTSSYLGCYSDHPSYMAYTQSSKAKVRSLSAPKQRPQYQKSSPISRYSANNQNAYLGSGRLDRPDRGGFSGGHWHRY